MKLIVGLGNPGKKYEHTRHNMGFDAVDLFSELAQIDVDKESFKGLVGRGKVFGEDIYILKPQTFMNLSGESVREIVNYFKIDINDIIVVYDEMALPVGKIRLRPSGSSGGHKGMQNIIEKLKGCTFAYLKSLNWIVLLGIALFCIALAIVNNIRVDDAKSVTWIGSQDVLEKPADIL